MDTHWFSMNRSLTKGLRIAGAALMVASAFGPLAAAPAPVQAKNLDWNDVRPPLTDDADQNEAGGFDAMPTFGAVKHAMAVAPNGDLFAGGSAGGDPIIFKSTNGGKNWRAITVAAPATSTVQQIVISPDYPSDNFVAFVFNDGVSNAAADNGICWTTDGGATWPAGGCVLSEAAATWFTYVLFRTVALSPDFNFTDGTGEIAIGGAWESAATSTVAIAQVGLLKTALETSNALGIAEFVQSTETDAADAVTDVTISLAYTRDEEPIALARLYTEDTGGDTYGMVLTSGTWPAISTALRVSTSTATMGSVVFDDEYSTGGSFFAGIGGGGAVGVHRFNGSTWANKSSTKAACDVAVSSLVAGGNGSTTKLIASLNASNIVCRSTNEGASWSSADADGGDAVCNACVMDATGAITGVAIDATNPSVVYWSSSAALGGVARSVNTGTNWADTGLTNYLYTVSSMSELDGLKAFATVSVSSIDAVFYTDNYGPGAGWVRVLRTSRTDLSFGPGFGDMATTGKAFARFNSTGTTTDKVLVTTNSGMTWDDAAAPDPFANGPVANENLSAWSPRSASLVYYGGDKGHVAVTTDGAASWTVLAKDFGEDIDELDFTSDPAVFFVTGEDTDTTNKVWMTKDSGGTFTQVGAAPWGTGDGAINLDITGYNATTNTGYLLVMTSGATSTDEVYRLKMPDGAWEDLDLDVSWTDSNVFATPGVGDGVILVLYQNTADGGPLLFYTNVPFTGDSSKMTPTSGSDPAQNLMLELPGAPLTTATSMSTAKTLPGATTQFIASNRVMEMTLPATFTKGITATGPINNISVASNIGTEGVPATFRWSAIPGADLYSIRIGTDAVLSDATVIGTSTSNQFIVTSGVYSLIAGSSYYWQASVQSVDDVTDLESPWSPVASFRVSTTSTTITTPTPNLPMDKANLPGLGTQLSWNNPAGVTQVHIQVTPLNGDGPAINLIVNATDSYNVPAPVYGTGPYVMLPGATYTWRLRTTGAAGSVGEFDTSWGPWSTPYSFTTAKPNAGSIGLVSPVNGAATSDTTPTLEWKSSNVSDFYYEVAMSSDVNFGEQGAKAPVYMNLIHGGVSTPANSWTVPDANALPKGQYYWRVRQRVQATSLGSAETGIAWGPAQSFVVN